MALSALMKIPQGKRPWVQAEALRRLVACPENDQRRYLLCECVQAYLPLEPPELREFEHLLVTPPFQEVRRMQATWFEQGLQQGLQEGLGTLRTVLISLLEDRFGELSIAARQKLESWPKDRLEELGRRITKSPSLKELGLED